MNFTEAQEFLLVATCTDAYGGKVYPLRIFLNGSEVLTTGIEAVTGQGNELRYYDLHPFIPLLKQGTNTIAVILQNTWATDFDDIAFDISIKAIPYRATSAQLKFLQTAPDVRLQCILPAGTIWELHACNGLSGMPWQVMDIFTNISAASRDVTDAGAIDHTRFYRLVPF